MNAQPGGVPPQSPYTGYHLDASEIRHERDLPVFIATWVIAVIGIVILGLYVSYGNYILMALGGSVILNFFSTFRALGNSVRVGPQQFPEVHQAALEAAARLGMNPVPVHVHQSRYLESSTNWTITGYYISLSDALVEAMDLRELQCVIGQRMGAVKLGAGPMHLITGKGTSPVFNTMGNLKLPGILALFSGLLSAPGNLLFSYWLRLRAHSYRRAGLVASQDIRSAMTAIVKELVGPDLFPYMNLPALLEQTQEMDRQFASGLAEMVGGMQDSMYINQIREMLRWYRSPAYQQIAARQGKMGTGTLGYAAAGTGTLFGGVAAQAQARKGWYSAEWDQVHRSQPVPPGYKLHAGEFRHPQEWLTLGLSWVAGIAAVVLLGLISKIFIYTALAMIPLYFTQYFTQVGSFGTMVRVTPQQFPGLYNILQEAADRLQMPMPPTFIKQEPVVNAYAAWVWPLPKYVVVHTGLIENFSPRELQYVIGHEYGHLKCGHTPFSLFFKVKMAGVLAALMGPFAFLMQFWFSWWSRNSETTADRAGLICTQDIRITVAGILKLATGGKGTWKQVNVPALVAQLEQMDHVPLRQIAQSVVGADHPFALYRAREAIRFYKSPAFQKIRAKVGVAQTGTLPQYAAGGTGVLLQAVAHQVQAAKADQGQAQAPAAYQAPQAPAQAPYQAPAQAPYQAPAQAPYQAPAQAPAAAPVQPPAPAPAQVPASAAAPALQSTPCPECGGANRPGAKFCGHCGHRFS